MFEEIVSVLASWGIDNVTLIGIGAGSLGGIVKSMYSTWISYSEGNPIEGWKFFLTSFISIVIGGAIGYLFSFDYRVSGLAGFAGLDILTNVAKASISTTKFTMNRK